MQRSFVGRKAEYRYTKANGLSIKRDVYFSTDPLTLIDRVD